MLDEWTPEPLVPNYEPKDSIINPRIIEGYVLLKFMLYYFWKKNILKSLLKCRPVAKYAIVNGVKSLNLASYNFLNMIGNEKINVN